MRYVPRVLGKTVLDAAKHFPALLLTGPRQSGKTTLLRRLFPRAGYVLLEDPDVISRVRSDPRTFLQDLPTPVILDEIQNAPELMAYIRTRIDQAPRQRGRWLLTGSQEAPLMRGVVESMAGRVAILQLLPLSLQETPKVSLLCGGFPPVLDQPAAAELWFRSYLQTYLERDVRAVTAVRDLATFRRFLALLAARCGSILNKTELAAPLGVSVPTITQWLGVLEVTGSILLVPPYFENFGKRLVKSPKLYFVDSGLACHLLGIRTVSQLRQSTFHGPLFEGFLAAEIAKRQVNAGKRVQLYFFRDQQGLEVDFIVPLGGKALALIEAKATRAPRPAMAKPLERLAQSMTGYDTRRLLVIEGEPAGGGRALAPGTVVVSVAGALEELG